jgi:hypothetical protein
MPTYNFKRNTQIYLVYAGLRYKLLVYPDVTFSQTFAEESYPVKTLHAQYNNFEGASIVKAAPANFSFSVPLFKENDHKIIVDLLLGFDNTFSSVNNFELYAVTANDTFVITNCIMEAGKFTIGRDSIFGISVSGTGSRLYRIGDESYSIPGTLQTPSAVQTYIVGARTKIEIGGVEQTRISDIYLEFKNNISWTQNDTIQEAMAAVDASTTIYPTDFTVNSRILNGAITRYIVDDATAQSWSINSSIAIYTDALSVIIPSAVFTNRLDITDIYTEVFDFRMLSNPTALSSVITYN